MKNFNKELEELKKNTMDPFSVPEGYFENFPTKMQERILSETKESNSFLKLLNFIKPQFALGFMIVAFAFLGITAINFILSNRTDSGMSNDLYTRIIEVDASDFSEQHFIDVLLEDEKEIIKKKEIEMVNYINYLVDEDIDYGTLIDEL